MKLSLDRNRPHGTVHGEHEFNAAYEQDDFLFDAHGEVIEASMDEKAVARLHARLAEEAAIEKARTTFREAMPHLDEETVKRVISRDNLKPAEDDGSVDLRAWAMGEKNYIFGKVTKAVREAYNQSPVNKAQCLEILAEHGVIPRSMAPTTATTPSAT